MTRFEPVILSLPGIVHYNTRFKKQNICLGFKFKRNRLVINEVIDSSGRIRTCDPNFVGYLVLYSSPEFQKRVNISFYFKFRLNRLVNKEFSLFRLRRI